MKGDDTNKREGTNKVGSDSVKDLWEQTQRIKRDERSSEFTSYVRGRNGCHECESARVRSGDGKEEHCDLARNLRFSRSWRRSSRYTVSG